jgi:hypothetical protein
MSEQKNARRLSKSKKKKRGKVVEQAFARWSSRHLQGGRAKKCQTRTPKISGKEAQSPRSISFLLRSTAATPAKTQKLKIILHLGRSAKLL